MIATFIVKFNDWWLMNRLQHFPLAAQPRIVSEIFSSTPHHESADERKHRDPLQRKEPRLLGEGRADLRQLSESLFVGHDIL